MDSPNFADQYSGLSNIELLKIVKRPDDFQKTAVDAATELLNNRNISDDELKMVEEYFKNIDLVQKNKEDKIKGYKENAADFLEPVLKPGTGVKADKWLNLLLLIIVLQYLWSLFRAIKYFIFLFQCVQCRFDVSILIGFADLIYVPIIFFLLYKKRRWGWILLFGGNLFSAISQLSQSYIYFRYWNPAVNNILSFLLPVIINAAFIMFLWRDDIAGFFRITPEVKKKTALVTIGITLVLIMAVLFIYG